MISFIKGDILLSDAQALVNTVNTVGVMGKGLALQFREAFPNNYNLYKKACKNHEVKIGKMFVTEDKNLFGTSKIIINFPTKNHWRLPSEYSYIQAGLQDLKKIIIERKIKSIAVPPLGAHNGGLDWATVKDMIQTNLNDLDSDIQVYLPNQEIKDKMKTERINLTPARAMLLILLADMCKHGEFPSTFAAEKIVYFMQKFGAKEYFKIDFRPYYYGPYSDGKISHVLYRLNGSYLMGLSAMDKKPFDFFWLTPDAEEAALNFLQCYNDKKIWNICNKTKNFLQKYYSPLTLELLATIDYILHNNKSLEKWESQPNDQLMGNVLREIETMSMRKKNLFKPEYVSIALNHLKANSIITTN